MQYCIVSFSKSATYYIWQPVRWEGHTLRRSIGRRYFPQRRRHFERKEDK